VLAAEFAADGDGSGVSAGADKGRVGDSGASSDSGGNCGNS
jgi:hypothetical protein